MKDQSKTKQLLIQELSSLRQRIHELEKSDSERKQAAEALQESEERYRELTNFLPISIFEVDAAGDIVSFNRTALKVFRYNEADYKKGMNALQFFVPEEWQRVGEKMGKVIQGTSTPGQEFTFIRKDGSKFIGLIYSAPNIQQNKAVGIKGAIIDITERKAAEEALQASSELFSLFIRHSPIYTYIKEVTPTQSLVLQASDNFGQMIGIPGSEMAGKNMTELFPPELAAKITGDDWAVVSGGDVLRLDEELNGRSYTTIKFPIIRGDKALLAGYTIDITERKQAEEALRESDERFRKLADSTWEGIVIHREGIILDANKSISKMFGWQPEEVIGKSALEFLAPESIETALQKLGEGIDTPQIYFEGKGLRKDKTVFHIEVLGRPIRYKNLDARVMAIRDITGSKLAEEELRENEEKIHLLLNSTAEAIYGLDMNGNCTFCNNSCIYLLGYKHPDDLLGKNMHWQIHAKYPDGTHFPVEECRIFQAFNKGEGTHVDDEVLWCSDGTSFPAEYWSYPQRRDGVVVGAVVTFLDITARKNAEAALRETETSSRTLIENSFDVIFTLNAEGTFLFVSPAWERHFGYPVSEVLGENFASFVHPDDVGACIEYLMVVLGTGKSGTSPEYRVKHADGSWRWFIANGSSYVDSKGQRQFMGTGRDITGSKLAEEEKRNLEERLNRAEKMESIGTLAGGVAHDLNNMLGALIGHAELLKGDLKKTDPMYNSIESIMTSGQKAAKVVQDLLTMARRGIVLKEPASLNKIVADQLKSSEIRNLLSFHSFVTIKTKYDRDLLDINASSIHIERALTNLISNALRAMRRDGTLTIRTENRYLEGPLIAYETVPKGEYAVLSVSDTGIGIFPEYMNNLFEPFYLRKVLKKGGSGLGLSVIWGAMKDHDGYIDVTSELGQGTTFSLYFPVTRDDTVRWVEHSVDEYRGYGETILVVDDEDLQCSVAEKMLTRLNYVVKTVESGEEALEYLADHDVDLIVLDMIMEPGIDGYDTYRRILEMKKRQKAIIFSGFTKTERVKMAQDLGAGEFIMKPYLMERLGIAVRKELDRKG